VTPHRVTLCTPHRETAGGDQAAAVAQRPPTSHVNVVLPATQRPQLFR
jgi:hypothetical protein